MKFLRLMMVLVACSGVGFAPNSGADTQQATVLNQHLKKLLGRWHSTEGDVIFNTNNTLVYKGQKNFCAVAQGTIQISKKHTTSILPYRFIDGQLLITDGGSVTTYTHVP